MSEELLKMIVFGIMMSLATGLTVEWFLRKKYTRIIEEQNTKLRHQINIDKGLLKHNTDLKMRVESFDKKLRRLAIDKSELEAKLRDREDRVISIKPADIQKAIVGKSRKGGTRGNV